MGLVHRILDIIHGETSTTTQKAKVKDQASQEKDKSMADKATLKSKEVNKENRVVPNEQEVSMKGMESHGGVMDEGSSNLMELEERKTVECISCRIISYSTCIILPTYFFYHLFRNREKFKLTKSSQRLLAYTFTASWVMIGMQYYYKVGIFRPMYEGETVWEYYKNSYRDETQKIWNKDFQGLLKYDPPLPEAETQEKTKSA